MRCTTILKRAAALLAAALCMLPVLAQSAGPALLTLDGDLWAWDGPSQPLTQLTDSGLNHGTVLSPDGTRAAYVSASSGFRDWLQTTQGAGGFTPPEDVWILDLPSRQTYKIADQPADAVWNGPSEPSTYTLRQSLTWSPDSRQIAWVEIAVRQGAFTEAEYTNVVHVAAYDLLGQTMRVIDSFDVTGNSPQVGVDRYRVQWGAPGILLRTLPLDGSPGLYTVYDSTGGVIATPQVDVPSDVTWMAEQGRDYLFDTRGFDRVEGYRWFDWRTGEGQTLPGHIEMYSLDAPHGATFALSGRGWLLTLPGQQPVLLDDAERPLGISRDGQAVLYAGQGVDPATGFFVSTLIARDASQVIEIGRTRNVQAVWGPVGWRVGE